MPQALALRPFQQEGRAFLQTHSRAILGCCMGSGKTAQALCALPPDERQRVLIIGPLATAGTWQREANRWLSRHVEILRRRDPLPAKDGGLYFIPWTDLAHRVKARQFADAHPWHTVIADEAHRAKGGTAVAQSKAFTGAWTMKDGTYNRVNGVCDYTRQVWMLTGTPMPNNRAREIKPLLVAAGVVGGPRSLMKSKDYDEQFCKQRNIWAPSGFDLNGNKDPQGLRDLVIKSGVFLRRSAEDIRQEIPGLQRIIVPLEAKEVKGADGMTLHQDTGLPSFEEMSEYRRVIGEQKVKPCAEWIKDHLEDAGPGSAVVVFCHHKGVAHALQQALGDCEVATGDEEPASRQAKVDRFSNKTGPPILIATMGSCATGMNGMHLRTSTCVFVECAWEPGTLDQAEGRVRRIGGLKGQLAMAYYLVAKDCLDQHIVETVNDKREGVKVIVDDHQAQSGSR
jgi:hypothetical protein